MACKPKPKPIVPDSEFVGFQFTFPNGIVKNKSLFRLILDHALNNLSKLGGKMVIAFPDSTPAKVGAYGKPILRTKHCMHKQKQTKATTCTSFSMSWPEQRLCQSDKSDLDNEPTTSGQRQTATSMETEPASLFISDDMQVETVGVTITDIRQHKPNNKSVVIRGFQFTFPDGIVYRDKSLFQLILNHALENFSKLGSKMVIAFPDATPAQVRDYCKIVLKTKCHQKQTKAMPKLWQSDKSDLDNEPTTSVQSIRVVTELASADIEVETVGVTTTDISDVLEIHNIITGDGHTPNISLVKLPTHSGTEALAVKATSDHQLQVTFISYPALTLNDYARGSFFRVQVASNIIWISYYTESESDVHLPIAVRQSENPEENNKYIYAEVPPASPDEPLSTNTRFPWLQGVLTKSSRRPVLFREHIADGTYIYHVDGITHKISKAPIGSHAIIDDSEMRFFVTPIYTYHI